MDCAIAEVEPKRLAAAHGLQQASLPQGPTPDFAVDADMRWDSPKRLL